jgi:hypothetical protein
MSDAEWAEWLMARFTGPGRASCIVGDILESNSDRGVFWFWLSVGDIVLWLNRRRLTAFTVAFACACCVPFLAPLHGKLPAHYLPETWRSAFVVLYWLALLLWMTAAYSAVRYGLRDSLGQLAFAFCVPTTIEILFWRYPGCLAFSAAVAIAVVISSVSFARWRKALLALLATTAVGYAGFQALLYAADFAEFYLDHNFAAPGLAWRFHRALPLLGPVILTIACGWIHRRVLQTGGLAEITQ